MGAGEAGWIPAAVGEAKSPWIPSHSSACPGWKNVRGLGWGRVSGARVPQAGGDVPSSAAAFGKRLAKAARGTSWWVRGCGAGIDAVAPVGCGRCPAHQSGSLGCGSWRVGIK